MGDLSVISKVGDVSVSKLGEVDTQIATAKQFQRDPGIAFKKALALATITKEVAESCVFSLPRGKHDNGKQKFITGPSIRAAEICASAWGNLRVKSEIIGDDGKRITAQATAWDLESNLAVSKTCQRSILTKDNKKFSEDMITVTGNAAASIAMRNAIFSVIPMSFIDAMVTDANRLVLGNSDEKLSERIDRMLKHFTRRHLTVDDVLKIIQKPSVADIEDEDLKVLLGISNSLKEGSMNIDELLDSIGSDNINARSHQSKSDELNAKLIGDK